MTLSDKKKEPGTSRVRLLIRYDGTNFEGWQRQSEGKRTVQGELETACARLFMEKMSVVGSGRTDAGVHAEGQVAHFRTTKDVSKYDIVRALNSNLPEDIAIQKAWLAPDDFHAQQSAISKTYRYQIHNSPVPDPLRARYSTWFKKPMNLDKLNSLSECLIGTKDFKSFQTGGTEVKTTIRTVTEAHWHLIGPNWVEFRISGTGFLKQMVRNIVGTLVYLEQWAELPQEMEEILQACDRQVAKGTAPAQGLHLHQVLYPPELDNRCREI